MLNMCIFVEYMCVQNLAEKVPLVIEILAKQHRRHFWGHPVEMTVRGFKYTHCNISKVCTKYHLISL